MNKAVILFSGGLDSTTCLAIAQSEGHQCHALSFAYGQRHSSELQAAKRIATHRNVASHRVVQLDTSLFTQSALTNPQADLPTMNRHTEIASTYVPARNTVFLSHALAYAEMLEAQSIFIGVSSVDYSGYPDCRPEFIQAFQTLAQLATKAGVEGHPIQLRAPLQQLSKAETLQLGLALGVDYAQTVSCYQANVDGEACGECDSCGLRKQGFREAGVADPTRYWPTRRY